MNKLLKRALMLGTLVVCLATAAWAGNVEMSWDFRWRWRLPCGLRRTMFWR